MDIDDMLKVRVKDTGALTGARFKVIDVEQDATTTPPDLGFTFGIGSMLTDSELKAIHTSGYYQLVGLVPKPPFAPKGK